MGTRENKVERHLDRRVKECGGLTRKWVSPGRDGVPDRIVLVKGKVWFVEVKTVDGDVSSTQVREIGRLRAAGGECRVLYGAADVDLFIEEEVAPWSSAQSVHTS